MKQLIVLIFALITVQLSAQRFKAYVALGANLTEDYLTQTGNSQVGSRLGLNAGPGVAIVLSNRWEANMELLYSQNGYYTNVIEFPPIALNKITLHYIEVPFIFNYRFNIKKQKEEKFYKRSIGGGLSYARLVNHKVIATDDTNVTDDVHFDNKNALLFTITASSFFNESFALDGRGALSTFGEWTVALRLLYYI